MPAAATTSWASASGGTREVSRPVRMSGQTVDRAPRAALDLGGAEAKGSRCAFDVITMGRIGVDLYPLQTGVPLAQVDSFGKFLGGSATNVAVAAARLGRAHGGDHPHRGGPLRRLSPPGAARSSASTTAGSPRSPAYPTPVTFCEIFPPDDFPLYFYRQPKAPDLEIHADELDLAPIRAAPHLLDDRHRPERGAEPHGHPRRARPRQVAARRSSTSTGGRCSGRTRRRPRARTTPRPCATPTVAVGNLDECEIATGEREPHAARRGAARRRASNSPSSSRAPRASSPSTATARSAEVPPVPVEVVNGLGAGRRVRRRALPRAARRLGPGADHAVRQRGRRHRRLPPGLLLRDADRRRGRGPRCARSAGDRRHADGRRAARRITHPPTSSRLARPPPGGRRRGRRPPGRRPLIGDSGRLMIVAADHPARGALGVGDRRLAMANRADLLERLCSRSPAPASTGCSPPPTSWRTCCCSASSTTRSSWAR